MLQRFSYYPEQTPQIVLLSTDVIITSPKLGNDRSWIIDTLTNTSFSFHQDWTEQSHVRSHIVTQTTDGKHLTEARDLLRSVFKGELAPTIELCLDFADVAIVQLPKKPKRGRFDRVNLDLFKYIRGYIHSPYWRITENGHVVFRSDGVVFVFEF
ncbi:hypothetical protein BJX64DRAFT_273147 [Aspergillus heterothallicus]